jgi:hypothetical protein
MGGYTRAVSGQRLGKGVPVARQQFDYNGRAVFSTWSVPRGYKGEEVWSLTSDSSIREAVKKRVTYKSAQLKVWL